MPMSEIPADIRAAADAVVERGYDEGLVDAVCRALLAERERCAKCCEGDFDYEMRGYGKAFAAMIRNAP
jgi:hypothetical protein